MLDATKKSKFGWSKAFSLYTWKYFRNASFVPIIISMVSLFVSLLSQKGPLYFICFISDLIVNIIPGIIGFLLSGYAIIIGFSSNEIVKFMSKKTKKEDRDLYQKQNAVFAVSILSLLLGLISGIFINFILRTNVNFLPNDSITNLFNHIVLFYLLFVVYFTILSIKDMVINVFNFGQLIHHLVNK